MPKYLLALDQGTTSSRAILFDFEGKIVSSAQYEFRQIYPGAGYVEHDPFDILETQKQAAADVLRRENVQPGEGRGRRRYEPAGDDHRLGPRDGGSRCTTPSSGSAAAPRRSAKQPHFGRLERLRAEDHGASNRRVFLRHEDSLYSRPHRKRAGARGERRTALWHRGRLVDLEPHRRACDGLFQRVAHDALRHPHARLRREASLSPEHPPLHAAKADAVQLCLRLGETAYSRAGGAWRRAAGGRGGRPAGGAFRAGVL